MSHYLHIPHAEKFDPKKGAALRTAFQIALAAGLLGSLITFIFSADLGAHGWLFAFFYAFTLLIGCLFWTCLHHATDAEWSVVVRRQMENLGALLKWAGVIFVPLAAIAIYDSVRDPAHSTPLLYQWMVLDPNDTLLAGTKSAYLNRPFFWVRVFAFFGLLWWISNVLRNRSIAQDKDGAARHTFSMRKFA